MSRNAKLYTVIGLITVLEVILKGKANLSEILNSVSMGICMKLEKTLTVYKFVNGKL